jgi:hypothetical protein
MPTNLRQPSARYAKRKQSFFPPEYLMNVGSILCKLGKSDPSPQWLERWKNDNIPRLASAELYELFDHDLFVQRQSCIVNNWSAERYRVIFTDLGYLLVIWFIAVFCIFALGSQQGMNG